MPTIVIWTTQNTKDHIVYWRHNGLIPTTATWTTPKHQRPYCLLKAKWPNYNNGIERISNHHTGSCLEANQYMYSEWGGRGGGFHWMMSHLETKNPKRWGNNFYCFHSLECLHRYMFLCLLLGDIFAKYVRQFGLSEKFVSMFVCIRSTGRSFRGIKFILFFR